MTFSFGALAESVTLDCRKDCGGLINSKYEKKGIYDFDHMKDINKCMTENYAASVGGPSFDEMRNFFEITGILYKQDLITDKSPSYEDKEIDKLKKVTREGLSKYIWLLGTTDCLAHANALHKHLQENMGNSEFEFEVVNSVPAVDTSKPIDFNAVTPMANHYVVRAVSKVTGKSYLVDGYTGVSVGREASLRKKTITFNNYEACFLQKATMIKREALKAFHKKYNPIGSTIRGWIMDESTSDALIDLEISITPMVKALVGEEAKSAAAACLAGNEKVSIKKNLIFD